MSKTPSDEQVTLTSSCDPLRHMNKPYRLSGKDRMLAYHHHTSASQFDQNSKTFITTNLPLIFATLIASRCSSE